MKLRRIRASVAAVALVGLFAAVPAEEAASAGAITISTGAIAPSVDYLHSRWGDPMDFNNPTDFFTNDRRQVTLGGPAWLTDGQLVIQNASQAFFLRSDPGSHAVVGPFKDPRARPLEAGRFSRVSFRMFSDRLGAASLSFRTCGTCGDGHRYFDMKPGWHTYEIDMAARNDLEGRPGGAPLLDVPWAGTVTSIWFDFAFNVAAKPTVVFDDFRITEPSESVQVTWDSRNGNQLWWDFDGVTSNDGTSVRVEGSANHIATGGPSSIAIPAGMFPVDRPVRFVVRNAAGTVLATSGNFLVDSGLRAVPVVTSPSISGGEDYARAVRGDPWDFNAANDVREVANATWGAFNSTLVMGPAGRLNDPVLVLDTRPRAIDASKYHKVLVRIAYDGPWGLQDAPGGGMVSRIIWRGVNGAREQVSEDLVMEAGHGEYVVDMRTDPPGAITDPAGNSVRIGWGVGEQTWLSHLRFDPHEDPGGRHLRIDEIRVLADERAGPGFAVRFRNDASRSGATYEVFADTDPYVVNGRGTRVLIGAVAPGENAPGWSGSGVGPGAYWVHVVIHQNGRTAISTSTGQVQVGAVGQPGPTPVVK